MRTLRELLPSLVFLSACASVVGPEHDASAEPDDAGLLGAEDASAPPRGLPDAERRDRDGGSTNEGDAAGPLVATPVYFTLVSHNERTLTRFGAVRESREGYQSHRSHLLEMAELIARHGGRLSYQTDYVVLDGVERFEAEVLRADPVPTRGAPLFEYLRTELGVSVEAHAHECNFALDTAAGLCRDQPYNYADVVARIRQVTGVTPPPILGGTSGAERSLEEWTGCIRGNVFDETWCPEVLTVFAYEAGHRPGSDDLHSGLWRPTALSRAEFAVDRGGDGLLYVGSGHLFASTLGARDVEVEPLEGVRRLLALVEAGDIPPGSVVTSSLMLAQDAFDDAFFAALEAILVSLEELAATGQLVFATYPEVVELWRARGSIPRVIEH